MWAHAEQLKTLVDSSWRYHIVAILMSIGIAFFALEQANRAQRNYLNFQTHAKQITQIIEDAGSVAGTLRQYLLMDYAAEKDEASAINSLIKDLRNARAHLSAAEEAIRKAPWTGIPEIQRFFVNAHPLSALLRYNDGTALEGIAPLIQNEASLTLADQLEGTIGSASPVTHLNLEDLARLAYIASARPAIIASLGGVIPKAPLGKESFALIMTKLEACVGYANSPFAVSTRRASERLWLSWIRAIGGRDSVHTTALRNASHKSLVERFVELQKSAVGIEEQMVGQNYFQLPVIGQHLSVAGAVWLLPFVVIVTNLLSAISLAQAASHVVRIDPKDRIGGFASPFLLGYPERIDTALAASCIQLICVFLPSLIMLAIGLLSPVVASQGRWGVALWGLMAGTVVSAGVLLHFVWELNRRLASRIK
jgi:hypothetical protein